MVENSSSSSCSSFSSSSLATAPPTAAPAAAPAAPAGGLLQGVKNSRSQERGPSGKKSFSYLKIHK